MKSAPGYILFCILSFILFINNSALAQKGNKLIRNSYAYCKFSSPGMIPVNPQGKPMATMIQERIIYLEIKGNATPVIETVRSGKYHFTYSTREITNFPESPGILEKTGKPVLFHKLTGYTLWRIDLSPGSDQEAIPARVLGNFQVKGSLNGNPFTAIIKKESAVQAQPRY